MSNPCPRRDHSALTDLIRHIDDAGGEIAVVYPVCYLATWANFKHTG